MNTGMMRHVVRMGVVFSTALWLSGCATPTQPSRFYRLESLSPPIAMPQPSTPGQPLPLVGIGPVQLASYLDRPQIVERSTTHRLTLHEFDRWAGNLQENTVQLLRDVIQRALRGAQVIGYPWSSGVNTDYEVLVTIDRFERQGMQMKLEAGWTLIAQPGGRSVSRGQQSFEAPLEGAGMEEVVAAASAVLEQLGDTLAGELKRRLSPPR